MIAGKVVLCIIWRIEREREYTSKENVMGKKILCPDCKGTGEVDMNEKCEHCHGTGQVEITDDWGTKKKVKCYPCLGTGKVKEKDTCPMCGGAGEIEV